MEVEEGMFGKSISMDKGVLSLHHSKPARMITKDPAAAGRLVFLRQEGRPCCCFCA